MSGSLCIKGARLDLRVTIIQIFTSLTVTQTQYFYWVMLQFYYDNWMQRWAMSASIHSTDQWQAWPQFSDATLLAHSGTRRWPFKATYSLVLQEKCGSGCLAYKYSVNFSREPHFVPFYIINYLQSPLHYFIMRDHLAANKGSFGSRHFPRSSAQARYLIETMLNTL